jgi:hypothetical protein
VNGVEATMKRRRRNEGGFALVAVLVVMMLLMAIAGALHVGVLAETQLRGSHAHATAGFYAAEAGINRGMGDYRNIFLNSFSPPSGSDFDEKTLTIGPRLVRYRLREACVDADGDGNPDCGIFRSIPAGRPFAGLNSQLYTYIANATSEVNAGDVEVTLGTQFDVNNIPLFQFLAFYENDLEILPGQPMTLNGPIHTNGSLYLNSSGSTLNIQDNPAAGIFTVSVTARNNVYRQRKNDNSCDGVVSIDKLADTNLDGSLDPLSMTCGGLKTPEALTPWLGAIRSQQPYVRVPSPAVLTRGSGDYWQQADLRIALDLTYSEPSGAKRIVVLTPNDTVDATQTARLQQFILSRGSAIFYNDVPLAGKDQATTNCTSPANNTYCNRTSYEPQFSTHALVYGCHTAIATCPTPGYMPYITLNNGERVYRRGGFYNNREKAWVYMLNVNLNQLLDWNRAQAPGNRLIPDPDLNDAKGGLVIYLTVKGPNSTGPLPNGRRYGVRVFGSPNLDFPPKADPTGVTVVSDQALYVEGNYNVNVGQPGYDPNFPKQPAAFMADTINVLSNNWSGRTDSGWTGGASCRNDCQSRRSLNSPEERPATTTYINAAFLSFVPSTVGSNYNGGLENYPRFHEKWTNQALVYRGSFVSLGEPSRANGAWCGTGGSSSSGCNIYDPPQRQWNYDTDFQQLINLPPITPRVVSVEQILFTENFR